MRGSAHPDLLYFDPRSKHAAIILNGKPVAVPTVIFVPRDIQYPNQFEALATSPALKWDDQKKLLYWKPNPALATNQIILYPPRQFHPDLLPPDSRALLPATPNHLRFNHGPTVGKKSI
jgi:phenylpropionate dioxygenase-like ring-hydroxylating dioxygenase large terminal subunit